MGKFLFSVLILIGVQLFAAYCREVDPQVLYSWYAGMAHGTSAIPNWFISLFTEGRLIKAPLCTAAYNVWWWISLCFSVVVNIVAVIILKIWTED